MLNSLASGQWERYQVPLHSGRVADSSRANGRGGGRSRYAARHGRGAADLRELRSTFTRTFTRIASRGGWTKDGTWVPIPPSTESTTTGWCDDRTGRSLLEQAQSAAQTPPTQPLPPPPCAGTAEPPLLPSKISPESPRIVSEHGKRSEKLGISRAVESNGKCFFLSLEY